MFRFLQTQRKSVAASTSPVEAELSVLLGQINVQRETGVAAINGILRLLTTDSSLAAISPTFLQSMYAMVDQDCTHYYPEVNHDENYPLPIARCSNFLELENAEPGFYAAFEQLFFILHDRVLSLVQTMPAPKPRRF